MKLPGAGGMTRQVAAIVAISLLASLGLSAIVWHSSGVRPGLPRWHSPSGIAASLAILVVVAVFSIWSVRRAIQRFVFDRTRTLAAVSHDLRSPLTRLRLRAETVRDVTTRTKMLKDIRTMELMITSTLAFIRDEAMQEPFERVDLAALLQTVCDDFDDAGCPVHYEGPLHLPAQCRGQALGRALNNLIDNAVRFGAVPLSASKRCRPP